MVLSDTKLLNNSDNKIKFDPYVMFFSIIGLSLVCPLLYFSWLSVYQDEGLLAIPVSLICCLGSITIMGNLPENKRSAKEIFWGWVIFSLVLTFLGYIGYWEIYLIKIFI